MTIEQIKSRLAELEADLIETPVQFHGPIKQEMRELQAQYVIHTSTVAVLTAKSKDKADHTYAKNLFREYLTRRDELLKHQDYAQRVTKATNGPSMTPVKPLATMGCGGGPLLCDHCSQAILLEGGRFDRVPADVAWKAVQDSGVPLVKQPWVSYISGGVVVEEIENGTLRIYHGHLGGSPNECSTKGKMTRDEAERKHVGNMPTDVPDKLLAFLSEKFPTYTEIARQNVMSDCINLLYSYNPGFGINKPDQHNS